MSEDLISKKDLLELTGISYGQLYRWKRKQLIPEEWFIRKSTFTGQETYLPRELILSRVNQIMNLKDDLSLDDLVGKLTTPDLYPELSVSKEELQRSRAVSEMVMERLGNSGEYEGVQVLTFEQALRLFAVEQLLAAGDISLEEGALLMDTLRDQLPKLEGKSGELLGLRKMGITLFLLAASPGEVHWGADARLIARQSMTELAQQLKRLVTGGGQG
ncbi:DUF4004 family protein [Paenibacillus sp. GCM10023252]|uniref:DUF4004 family protein n=1 Tax=Paenibacillus sp. GCM10023252 TaxID=3252649 RepID=UPI00361DD95D